MSEENNLDITVDILSRDRIGLTADIVSAFSVFNAEIIRYRAKVFTDNKSRKMSKCRVNVSVGEQELRALLGRLSKIRGVVSVAPVYGE